MKQIKRKFLVSLLAASLLGQTAFAAAPSKEEVVYVTLNSSGAKETMVVVNSFETNGSKKITDYGNYKNIKNLSSTAKPHISGNQIIWETDGIDKFYYQGEIDAGELPWDYSLSYQLDGVPLSGEELIGKSGHVIISLEAKSNEKAADYYKDNYMAQITMTLDSEICKNITCPDAVGATVGSTRQLTFMVLPTRTKKYTISFDAKDFEMDGLTIAMIKLSDGVLGNTADNAASAMSSVTSGISQLLDGSGQLKNGSEDLVSGIALLNSGSQGIRSSFSVVNAGMSEFGAGTAALSNGLSDLTAGSAQIRSGISELDSKSADVANGISSIEGGLETMLKNKQKLRNGITQLKNSRSSLDTLESSGQTLKNGYKSVFDGLGQISSRQAEVQSGLNTLHSSNTDISALSAGLDSLSEGVSGISSAMSQQEQLLDALIAMSKDPAMTQYLQNAKAIASGVRSGASTASGGISDLKTGAAAAQNGINTLYNAAETFGNAALEMTNGAATMRGGMQSLNDGLAQYTDGVGQAGTLYSSAETFANSAWSMMEGAQKLYDGTKTLRNGFDDYAAGVGELSSGYMAIDNGIAEASGGANNLRSGSDALVSGADTLFGAVDELTDSINKLDNAAGALPSGVDTLQSGTQTLYDGISAVDLAAMLSRGDGQLPLSFAAPRTAMPEKVQFLAKTPNLHIPDDKSEKEETGKKSVWQKIKELFVREK